MKIVGIGRYQLKKKTTLYNLTTSNNLVNYSCLNWIRDNRIGSIYIFDTLDTLAELRVSTVSRISRYTPGILMTVALMITVSIIAHKRGYAATRDRIANPKQIIIQALKSIWALVIPFVIILGMRMGVCTPTEAPFSP